MSFSSNIRLTISNIRMAVANTRMAVANTRMIVTAMLMSAVCVTAMATSAKPTPINIWADTPCQKSVRLTPYLAEGSDNIACIVCPGGSYFWHDMPTEGRGVAEWLQANGISAFVLEYRVGGKIEFVSHSRIFSRGNRFPDMLLDVQRSIQLVRERAEEFGINPNKTGVMGFSAGGHLSAMSGIYFDNGLLASAGVNTSVSLRPDFIAPIYPVVSMSHTTSHKRSRRGALADGGARSMALRDSLSLEKHVRSDMPPTYLMNCVDDPIVHYHNAEMLDSAMTAMGVNHKYRQFKTGGHGFGANPSKTTPEAATWMDDFLNWIKQLL